MSERTKILLMLLLAVAGCKPGPEALAQAAAREAEWRREIQAAQKARTDSATRLLPQLASIERQCSSEAVGGAAVGAVVGHLLFGGWTGALVGGAVGAGATSGICHLLPEMRRIAVDSAMARP